MGPNQFLCDYLDYLSFWIRVEQNLCYKQNIRNKCTTISYFHARAWSLENCLPPWIDIFSIPDDGSPPMNKNMQNLQMLKKCKS